MSPQEDCFSSGKSFGRTNIMPQASHTTAAQNHESAATEHKAAAALHGKGQHAEAMKKADSARQHSEVAQKASAAAHGKSSTSAKS
jgi:hypothetical protein